MPARRSPKKKSRKPKVVLAKNKVLVFCGLICAICVSAIAVSVAFNPQIAEKAKAVEVSKTAEKAKVTEKPKTAEKPKAAEAPKIAEKSKNAEKPALVEKPKPVEKPKSVEKTKTVEAPKIVEKNDVGSQKAVTKPVEKTGVTVPKKVNASSAGASQKNVQVASLVTPKQNEATVQNAVRNRFDLPPASNGATIVIVIDDAGRSAENTRKYAELPFPITIAVLPKLPQSRQCADVIRSFGKEVILHQPMQAANLNLDPGPGAIKIDMTTYEIAEVVKQNLQELGPGVKGMNNHEGSLITSNEIKIGAVLEVCQEKGVYFLDSRTTAATKAPQAALERDMQIFEKAGPYLDNDIDRAKMLERMRETLAYANRHGRAIVIGHVDKSVKILPDLLAEMYPEMRAKGYKFATPSMLR